MIKGAPSTLISEKITRVLGALCQELGAERQTDTYSHMFYHLIPFVCDLSHLKVAFVFM